MLRYKALQILKTFSDGDIKKFNVFLASPFFNTSTKVAQLYRILSKFHPNFNSQKLTNKFLKKKIGTTSDSTLKNLLANLYHLSERYLAHTRFNNSKTLNQLELINELEVRKEMRIAKKKTLVLKKEVEQFAEFHADNLLTLFRLEVSLCNIDAFNEPIKGKDTLQKHLGFYTRANEYIFYFYIYNFLNAYIVALTICKLLNTDPEETSIGKFNKIFFSENKIEEFLNCSVTIKNTFLKDLFNLKRLYLLIRLGKNIYGNSTEYIKILRRISDKLELDEKYDFYLVYNLWSSSIHDHPEFEEHEFKFYDDLLKKEAYKSGGQDFISLRGFRLLYTRGDTSGRYEWTNKLMKKHITAINPEYRCSLTALRNCFILIYKDKNIELAAKELEKVQHHNETGIKIDIKHLKILIYFEKKQYDKVINVIETFTKYLNKPNALMYDKLIFINFLKFIKKLTILKSYHTKIDYTELNFLKKQIEASKYFPSKTWILEKINEIM